MLGVFRTSWKPTARVYGATLQLAKAAGMSIRASFLNAFVWRNAISQKRARHLRRTTAVARPRTLKDRMSDGGWSGGGADFRLVVRRSTHKRAPRCPGDAKDTRMPSRCSGEQKAKGS